MQAVLFYVLMIASTIPTMMAVIRKPVDHMSLRLLIWGGAIWIASLVVGTNDPWISLIIGLALAPLNQFIAWKLGRWIFHDLLERKHDVS